MKSNQTRQKGWWGSLAAVVRREFSLIFHDAGVMLFFFALPLFYPVVYTLIYNPETVKEMHVAVVDQSRTADSRKLTRMVDATDAIDVYAQAATVDEARRMMNSHEVYGILYIPDDYAKAIGRGEQANPVFYSEMSLLLRYRAFLSALTDVQLATGSEITTRRLNTIGLPAMNISGQPVGTQTNFMGDTQQGFASFIIPGIVVLILQQSMILGICMIAGTAAERRRRNPYFTDRLGLFAFPSAVVLGKALCYTVFYIPFTIYILHYIPEWFNLPHQGDPVDYLLFIFPFLLASACFGIMLSYVMRQREDAFIYIVFSSLIFLFLSGITWPRFAMSGLWHSVADCVPATWALEGFVRINSNGATLAEESGPYMWLWALAAAYFAASWFLQSRRRKSLSANAQVAPQTAAAAAPE